jgi:8-oxo-dGTP diphosphatase
MVNMFVLAFLFVGDTVLLLHRHNTNFGDGLYSLVGGKVDAGETARQAIKREVAEEVGLDIIESAFELAHVLHRNGSETEFVAICFKVDIAHMDQPLNMEPDKHDDMQFFAVDQLPKNILPAHKQIIEKIAQHINYSEHGW